MDNDEKILISKGSINSIISGLSSIKVISQDKGIRKEAEKLLKMLQYEVGINSKSLEDRIREKMKETKSTDPDMNANLYILHRKLVNKQITEEQALKMFETYVKIEPYDKKIF
ncbi:hypothetical protein D4Z93_09175 [Clostridium fermenticellae]|uniref:Uncharacterized protein n=1 Tax=Clostridium fermenticellae TaxID=2068654 RepID=A0A386H586_9CLOT|nr:hypothetical protein [Clostridium fermenticellae]AYD40693.1 hypothetical protein D4Z93_09175 [Clostridium fermenticellae]